VDDNTACVIKATATEVRRSVNDDYITIAQAARLAGYRNPRTLHRAATEGRLRTTTLPPFTTRVTTRAWLDEYLAGIKQSMSHRGRPHASGRSADLEDLD
jgi:hypothetical protein